MFRLIHVAIIRKYTECLVKNTLSKVRLNVHSTVNYNTFVCSEQSCTKDLKYLELS
jgi:hypothetical protein